MAMLFSCIFHLPLQILYQSEGVDISLGFELNKLVISTTNDVVLHDRSSLTFSDVGYESHQHLRTEMFYAWKCVVSTGLCGAEEQ